MDITQQDQYNQSISRYKLLSANAGVGAIITSNIGNYILISDVNKWEFISAASKRIQDIRNDAERPFEQWYREAKKQIVNDLGVELVDDERFVEFLKKDKGLPHLLCLAAIPHLSLDERFNTINVSDNPIIKRLKARGIEKRKESFAIPGTHFPKWFRNEKGLLQKYDQWKAEWKRSGKSMHLFAPPRDANDPYPTGNWPRVDKAGNEIRVYKELTQLNLILLCENGHLSDIPWSEYLRWRTETRRNKDDGADLFRAGRPCCDAPQLKWSESKNRSEGYASIHLECSHCGMGDGKKTEHPKINLEGINGLKPICPGHKPWEVSLEEGRDHLPFDPGCCDKTGKPSVMQVALVTGNNVYFANTFSSVYIPIDLVKGIPEGMERLLSSCHQRYEKISNPAKTRHSWADKYINDDLLDEFRIESEGRPAFLQRLSALFIRGPITDTLDGSKDLHEQYRQQEYEVLTQYRFNHTKGLRFNDIDLPVGIARYFEKIAKVEELKVTSVQLDFTRIKPNERVMGADRKIVASQGKNIFSDPVEEVFILPAVENFGEGIFFEFKKAVLEQWASDHEKHFEERLKPLLPIGAGINGNALRQKILYNGPKYLLIHTFSHLMMRELEFTCGYPTASLKERLYIGPDMAGVLIYTAEGSEGSMGGLVWQADPERIKDLLDQALERAIDCSSDPLCWESDGQGLFNLNLAACFSCGLVAETACEERNLALDRQVLIHPDFGFFL